MEKNYTLWIVGAIAVIVVGFMLFNQSPTLTPTTSDATDTIDTDGTQSTGTKNAGMPVVVTTGFASVSSTTAVVVGTVNPKGAQTTYWFEYGPTLSLGFSVNATVIPAGRTDLGAAAYIIGLTPNTTYYFRLGAKNAYGTVYGSSYNFITAAK